MPACLRPLPTLLLLLFGLFTVRGVAQNPPNPQPLAWNAAWIACPDAPQKDAGVFYFRKELTLAAVPAHFRVRVSADNREKVRVLDVIVGPFVARPNQQKGLGLTAGKR